MPNHLFKFILTIAFIFLSFSQVAQAAYDLEWDRTEVKIDLKPSESEARAEFVVTNKGKETVLIDRINTSCGCTGSILNQKKIKPGESATIIGTFTKKNRQGLNHNRLQVFIKGHAEPAETLHMLVQVPRLIDVSPSIVYWNQSSPKTERKVQIKLDTRYLNEISSIEYDADLISVTEEDDPDGKVDRILAILPKSFDKPLRQSVLIKAKGPDDLTAETKLQVFVQP